MYRRFITRSAVNGEISLPAVPGLIDEYVRVCAGIFAGVGREFSDDEIAHLRSVLEGQLATAYSASPRSSIVISYNASVGSSLNYEVQPEMVDGGGRLRRVDQHPRAAAVRHRTRRAGVGAG